MTRDYLENGPKEADTRLILAHGAGAPMDHEWMTMVAEKIAAKGVHVVRFNFDYMAEMVATGKKKPPQRAPHLLTTWQSVLADWPHDNLIIGGKSMGGRMASMLAADLALLEDGIIAGVWCLGYPFHPPGKPEKLRTEHLSRITVPLVISQGERDSFGKKEEVDQWDLPASLKLFWADDGDHGLKPRVKSGRTLSDNLGAAIDHAGQIFGF